MSPLILLSLCAYAGVSVWHVISSSIAWSKGICISHFDWVQLPLSSIVVKDSEHFIVHMPHIVLSALCLLSHLILTVTLWNKFCYYHPISQGENVGTKKLSSEVAERVWSQVVWRQSTGRLFPTCWAVSLNSHSQSLSEKMHFPRLPITACYLSFGSSERLEKWYIWSSNLHSSSCDWSWAFSCVSGSLVFKSVLGGTRAAWRMGGAEKSGSLVTGCTEGDTWRGLPRHSSVIKRKKTGEAANGFMGLDSPALLSLPLCSSLVLSDSWWPWSPCCSCPHPLLSLCWAGPWFPWSSSSPCPTLLPGVALKPFLCWALCQHTAPPLPSPPCWALFLE